MQKIFRKFINRALDIDYIGAYIKNKNDARIINDGLNSLVRYHSGEVIDFKPIRDQLLHDFIKYTFKKSNYYKKILGKLGVDVNNIDSIMESWSLIPFLDKKIIKSEENSILMLAAKKNYITHMTTGGSTGNPFGFSVYGGHDSRHQEFLYKIMGYIKGDKILALDGTLVSKNDLDKDIFWTKKSEFEIPYGSMSLSSHYLNNKTIESYLKYIEKLNPSIIRGYPSVFDYLSRYINENQINLKLNIKGIQLTSESFSDQQVKNISKAFGTKVYSQYGHAEASVFGYSIDESLMIYCSPFYGLTEVIDENGIHVKSGQIGEIVVTGFNNLATPFVRYRTGDLAVYDGEENGIVKLVNVYGRTQDVIFSPNMEEVRLTALVFGRHYHAFNNIEKWQIVQNKPGEVIFKIVKSRNFNKEDEDEIKENFISIGNIVAKFEFVESIQNTKRGKSKLLIQNINII